MKSFLERDKNKRTKIDDYLELIASGVMKLRLRVMCQIALDEGKVQTFQLNELLQMEIDFEECIKSKLLLHLCASGSIKCMSLPTMPRNDSSLDLYFRSLNAIKGIGVNAIKFELNPDECFDPCWMTPQSQLTNTPFVLLMACKSKRISAFEVKENSVGGTPTKSAPSLVQNARLPGDGRQAKAFHSIVQNARKRKDICLSEGSFFESLVEGRYLYAYLVASDAGNPVSFGDSTIVLQGVDSQRFLCYFNDFYRLLRIGCDESQESDLL